jgi:hypothetical protein
MMAGKLFGMTSLPYHLMHVLAARKRGHKKGGQIHTQAHSSVAELVSCF